MITFCYFCSNKRRTLGVHDIKALMLSLLLAFLKVQEYCNVSFEYQNDIILPPHPPKLILQPPSCQMPHSQRAETLKWPAGVSTGTGWAFALAALPLPFVAAAINKQCMAHFVSNATKHHVSFMSSKTVQQRERATSHESLIKTNDLRRERRVFGGSLSRHVTSSRTARGHRGRKWRWSANGRRCICTETHVDVHLELKQQKMRVAVIVPCRAAACWQVVWFIAGYMLPEKVSNMTLMSFHSSTVKRKLPLPLIV